MAHSVYTDYFSGGSRSSSRNGGPAEGSIHIRDILESLDRYQIPTNYIECSSRSSQTISQLTQTLIDNHYDNGCPANSHGYIFGGLCDITQMNSVNNYHYQSRLVRYEETTFNYSMSEAYDYLIHEIAYSNNRLRAEGIRPCFATIPPASLEKWNHFRLSRGKTALLLHEERYPNMQEGLNTVLTRINGFICKLNSWNKMYTPYVATTVLRTKTSGGGRTTLQHHKLYDGVHADDRLIVSWADKFEKAINKNRNEHYQDWQRCSSLSVQLDADMIRSMIYS